MIIYKIANDDNVATISKYEDGNCFKNVIDWISKNSVSNSIVVHGKITNFQDSRIDHAWIEIGDEVIDPTAGVKMNKIRYYSITKAEADAKYSEIDTLVNAVRSGNGGPWTKAEVGNRYLFRID